MASFVHMAVAVALAAVFATERGIAQHTGAVGSDESVSELKFGDLGDFGLFQ